MDNISFSLSSQYNDFELPKLAARSISLPVLLQEQVLSNLQNTASLDSKRVKLEKDSITPPATPPGSVTSFFRLDASTPCKTSRNNFSQFKAIKEEISQKKTINFEGKELQLGNHIYGGSFMDVYCLGDDYVIKVFKDTHFNKSSDLRLKSYVNNAMQNYEALKAANFSVATIYNSQTASSDGYYIQQLVPNNIDLNNDEHLKKVNEFFVYATTEQVICDLHPGNFGVNNEGAVTLFDFVEDPEEGLAVFINQGLRLWREKLEAYSSDPAWVEQKYKIITNNLQIKEYYE